MNNDEKILKALENIEKRLNAQATKEDVKRIEKRIEGVEKRQESQGLILAKVGNNIAQVLVEQQQQQTDMRYFHDDLNRIEEKVDRIATDVKSDKERIENLEEATNTHNPHKN